MEPKEKIAWFAVASRTLILLLQFLFNILCPDHEADAFRSPQDHRLSASILDRFVTSLLQGLTRWDAQYFIHISKFGYTYENTLAFYPFFPMLVRFAYLALRNVFFFLNIDSVVVLSGVAINIYCFAKAATTLYDLTTSVTKSPKLAYKAAMLFCINPASIFFSALYTESLFSYLTFSTMLASFGNNFLVFLPLSLSMITRSNGITNIGFPIFYWLQDFSLLNGFFGNKSRGKKYGVISSVTSLFRLSAIMVLSFVPLVALQVYNYVEFCKLELNETTLPVHVVHYAIENQLLLARSKNHPPWCYYNIPLSYSYVQNKYWDVGFFSYYRIKQIPNFLLALPIIFIMLKCISEFFKEHKNTKVLSLMLPSKNDVEKVQGKYPARIFPFVVHGMFLTLFSVLFVHVQVSTRMILSSTPLPYWFAALAMGESGEEKNFLANDYEDWDNVDSKWRVFFMTRKKLSLVQYALLTYFLGYFVVGCFMYSNFLPWT